MPRRFKVDSCVAVEPSSGLSHSTAEWNLDQRGHVAVMHDIRRIRCLDPTAWARQGVVLLAVLQVKFALHDIVFYLDRLQPTDRLNEDQAVHPTQQVLN